MTYLVDANVLSEPTKRIPIARVVDWLAENEGELVVDSIILGELRVGVLRLPNGRRRDQLANWFITLAQTIDCLPWDAAVSGRWAELVVDLRRRGQAMPLLDGMIAATALQHGLIVATHNRRDFEKTGVPMFDPFD
ncbi:MAG TPA: PIN domain-containing protein [Dehalococcoidia bacterium]|nr:PIN domain-containing protein [Dehalococcoidia bacterium]